MCTLSAYHQLLVAFGSMITILLLVFMGLLFTYLRYRVACNGLVRAKPRRGPRRAF